jgi:hypothetical protein
VTRKPDLETQNWVYSFSSFIEPYQTHIVTAQMLSTFFHLLDRVIHYDISTRKIWDHILMDFDDPLGQCQLPKKITHAY